MRPDLPVPSLPSADQITHLIFSRKGLDSAAGGQASPILSDGRLVPIPIPESGSYVKDCGRRWQRSYRDIQFGEEPLSAFLPSPPRDAPMVHLDPDLRRDALPHPRGEGWCPALGQAGAAESHLRGQGVGPGALFLFFGWFRQTEGEDRPPTLIQKAPHLHVLFGWLHVDRVFDVTSAPPEPWLASHAHFDGVSRASSRVYCAKSVAGGGVFPRFDESLQLTWPGCPRGIWRLPAMLSPSHGAPPLSFHSKPARWADMDGHARLQTASRGQEFVMNVRGAPQMASWALKLIEQHAAK